MGFYYKKIFLREDFSDDHYLKDDV